MTAGVPEPADVQAEEDPNRRAILEGMQRIAAGRPLKVPVGDYSVVALATEAGVKRHWLNQTHRDLRDRWQFIRISLEAPAPATDPDERVAALKAQIEVLETKLHEVRTQRDEWRAAADLFVRAMNVQEAELAARDLALTRLNKRLEALSSKDELAGRRHRRKAPAPDVRP